MERYNKSNLAILYDKDIGLLYDVPTNLVLKVPANVAEFLEGVQSGSDSYEKQKFEKYMRKYTADRDETIPTHHTFLDDNVLQKLTIMLANTCNLACKYCFANEGAYDDYKQQIMSPKTAINYINALLDSRFYYINHVQFFGGEPMLGYLAMDGICNHFEKLYNQGKIKRRPIYTIITNLTVLDEYALAIIKKHNIKVTVSIDGPKDIHDRNRVTKEGKGTFDIVERNIMKLGSNFKAIEATYTKEHLADGWTLDSLKRYFRDKYGINTVVVACALGENEHCFNPIKEPIPIPERQEIDTERAQLLKAFSPEFQNDLMCTAGFNALSMMSNGDLFPCHTYALDKRFKMGYYDPEDGYKSLHERCEKVWDLLSCNNKNENEKCKLCWMRKVCKKCLAQELYFGSYGKYTLYPCEKHVSNFKEFLLYAVKQEEGVI